MLTQDALNELLEYNPDTGELRRRVPSRYATGRKENTSTLRAYQQFVINGKPHRAHRLIWLMVYGEIPKGMVIDHVNGNKTDNRLCNLRLASVQQNIQNAKLSSHNRSGYKGVSKRRGKWRAVIKVDGRQRFIGHYDCPIKAARAYDTAAAEYYGEYARTNKRMGLLNE